MKYIKIFIAAIIALTLTACPGNKVFRCLEYRRIRSDLGKYANCCQRLS